jgi:hypothetical protein
MRVIGVGKKLFHGQNNKQFQAYFKLNDHSLTTTHPSCQGKKADSVPPETLPVPGAATVHLQKGKRLHDDVEWLNFFFFPGKRVASHYRFEYDGVTSLWLVRTLNSTFINALQAFHQ